MECPSPSIGWMNSELIGIEMPDSSGARSAASLALLASRLLRGAALLLPN